MVKRKDLVLASKRINYKLRMAFYLFFLPSLVCFYFAANYIWPRPGFKLDIILYLLATLIISFAGFILIKQVFGHILFVTRQAKLMASGDSRRRIDVKKQDEVGDLAEALNLLVANIRTDMSELKSYGEKTVEMNLEIQKRVFLLSSMLEISSLISQGASLEDIFKITVEKSRALCNSDVAYLLFREPAVETFYVKAADGLNSQRLLGVNILSEEKIFNEAISQRAVFILDGENKLPQEQGSRFREKFNLKNSLAMPVFLKDRVFALLGIGNNKDSFVYAKDDIGLLDVLSRQVAIAVENDLLLHRVEKLEIKDGLTGLYNEVFIRNCLQEEIRRAMIYQRPCALVLFDVDNFKEIRKSLGLPHAERVLKKLAALFRSSVSAVDRVARITADEFAVVLPEKNKRQAKNIAEDIRNKVEKDFSQESGLKGGVRVSAGISENPIDGIDADELFFKARASLRSAKEQGKNRVV
ncbi:MAG: diguanylate cyclase [Candidatus Omnitrophica bacterium]|nr:diguanylate cyclase [Candidatus Omnitrophota bacterium]